MKIAVICDVLGEANNGTTIAALNLIRTLREKGHEVRVVCPDADRAGEPGYYIVPKYDFHIFNEYVEKNGVAPAKLDTRVPEAAIHDVDVIHVMIPFALGKAAAHYAHDHGIALTAGFHCQAENITNHIFLQNSPKANTAVYHILYDRLYRYCDCIHYPTQFIKDTFEAIVGPTNGRVISNPDAVSLPFLQTLVTMLGVIPIPNKFSGMRQFLSSVQQRYQENNVIAIFPEAHIWPFYTGIRPFSDTSFRYPEKLGAPVVAMVTTYRRRRGLGRLLRRPGMTITLSEPFYPDAALSAREAQQKLRDQVYHFMVSVASSHENICYFDYQPARRNESREFILFHGRKIYFLLYKSEFRGIILTVCPIAQYRGISRVMRCSPARHLALG